MAGAGDQQQGGGCATCIVVVIVLALVFAAVISIAALVDPFSWLPPVGEIWEDCEDDFETSRDECDLAVRFPGFWPHVIVNFAYAATAAGLLLWVAAAVIDLREARVERFSSAEAVDRYSSARQALAAAASLTGSLAVLPVVLALV